MESSGSLWRYNIIITEPMQYTKALPHVLQICSRVEADAEAEADPAPEMTRAAEEVILRASSYQQVDGVLRYG
jgi:hypothetical protein